jgi:hypothetical protein
LPINRTCVLAQIWTKQQELGLSRSGVL